MEISPIEIRVDAVGWAGDGYGIGSLAVIIKTIGNCANLRRRYHQNRIGEGIATAVGGVVDGNKNGVYSIVGRNYGGKRWKRI